MNTVSIYALVDPRDGRKRYVGKTCGSLRVRLLAHINDVKRGRVYIPRHRWISGLLEVGCEPSILLLESVPQHHWEQAEQSWIQRLRDEGCDLLNATAGGDGLVSYRHRDDTRQKQSEAAKARYRDSSERAKTGHAVRVALASPETRERLRCAAKQHSPEHKQRFREGSNAYARSEAGRAQRSAMTKGRVVSEETRRKISVARLGQKPSPENIAKRTAKIRGRKYTAAHRKAISDGHLRYHERRRMHAQTATQVVADAEAS